MPSVNKNLLPMKAHYFLWNAGTSPVVPFIPTLAKQLGFSSVVVGSLYTALPIMGMLVKPTLGAIADRYKCQKAVFLGFLVLTLVSFFPLLFVPSLPTELSTELHCSEETNLRVCHVDEAVTEKLITEGPRNTTFFCNMRCDMGSSFLQSVCSRWDWTGLCNISLPLHTLESLHFDALLAPEHTVFVKDSGCLYTRVSRVESLSAQWHVPYCDSLQVAQCRVRCQSDTLRELATLPDSEVLASHQFWLFTSLLMLSWVGMAVVVSVGDAICFSILGEQPSRFGRQRLWGSLGWGVSVVVAGFLVDWFSGTDVNKDYSPVFYMMAIMLALDLVVSSRFEYTQPPQAASIVRNVGLLFTNTQVIVFMAWLVVVGMCTALIWNFLLWYLEELAEQSATSQHHIKTLEGLVNGVQCFGGEIPFFFLSGWILKKIGHIHAMSLILFAFGVRFLLYSVLTEPWWCLPVELLNGLTFGLLYATMASYASLVAPPGTDTTVQGLVGAIFEGIGVSSGSFLAGLFFSQTSGAMVFRTAGLAVLVLCVLHISVQFFLTRRNVLLISQAKDFNGGAHYASPSEAIHMLDEPSYRPLDS